MYVCLCNGITDREIKEAVETGATSLGAVKRRLGVSNQCGSCAGMAESIISNHRDSILNENLYYQVA